MSVYRISRVGGFWLLMAACGERFTAESDAMGGAGGRDTSMAGAKPSAGGDTGAQAALAGAGGVSDGGDPGVGGSETSAGGGDSGGGGRAGGSSGGSASGGKGGSGSVVETPLVPQEGLELWFDAQLGVTEVNGAVTTWKDRSSHRRDALQSASNYRPKLIKNGPGDKAAIQFDGENDFLKVPALPGDFSQGLTIVLVNRQHRLPDECNAFFEASKGPETNDVHVGTWRGALLYEVREDLLHATEEPLRVDAPQLLAVVHAPSGVAQLRRNSAAVKDGTMPVPETIERENVYIGHSLYGGCQDFGGELSELLVYSRSVGDLELIEIETYLQTKWGCCSE